MERLAESRVAAVLSKWRRFEKRIMKKPLNSDYFTVGEGFDNYYKGKTLNDDIKAFAFR